jgi:hypothetical protein
MSPRKRNCLPPPPPPPPSAPTVVPPPPRAYFGGRTQIEVTGEEPKANDTVRPGRKASDIPPEWLELPKPRETPPP